VRAGVTTRDSRLREGHAVNGDIADISHSALLWPDCVLASLKLVEGDKRIRPLLRASMLGLEARRRMNNMKLIRPVEEGIKMP
jgi:hypothetical protein